MNDNCLEGRHCPKCFQSERFKITATSVFELFDDGTGDHEDVEYDEDSYTRCTECGWEGKWGETVPAKCIHCGEPVIHRPADGELVHMDEDEDPAAEDYGWGQCSGGATMVELPQPTPKQRYWASWLQPTEDYRAVNFPPNEAIIGYWCSGYGSDKDDCAVPILCAVIDAENLEAARTAVLRDWPEWKEWRFIEEREPDYQPGDRFPIDESEWMQERFNKHANG